MDETLTPGQDASERADAEPLESLPGASRQRPHVGDDGQGVNHAAATRTA